jgi:hypothetical protein
MTISAVKRYPLARTKSANRRTSLVEGLLTSGRDCLCAAEGRGWSDKHPPALASSCHWVEHHGRDRDRVRTDLGCHRGRMASAKNQS